MIEKAPYRLWIDWTPFDEDTMPTSVLAYTPKSDLQAGHQRINYVRESVVLDSENERGARICEALHRRGVSPEKWPDYLRVRAAGDALLAKEKQP